MCYICDLEAIGEALRKVGDEDLADRLDEVQSEAAERAKKRFAFQKTTSQDRETAATVRLVPKH